jgi:long-subunit fatty acid transport protein
MYGPNANGHQQWSKNGGQRYMLTELDVLLVYYSLAVAYGKKDVWGAGITLQAAHQPVTKLSLVVDGVPGGQLAPYYAPNDVESTISVSGAPVPTAVLGLWWRPLPELEIGASGRPYPVKVAATGDVTLQNMPAEFKSAQFSPEKLKIENSAARLTLSQPPYAKVGARYRGLDGDAERFDVELDLVWEGWSVIDKYQVELDGTIKLFAKAEAPDVVIEKRWKDTLSARVGGTYNLPAMPLSLSTGGYYESGAVPNDYTHLDFPSFDRVGLGAGVGYKVGKADLQASYLHVFQESRAVDERFGRVYQQRPVAPCPQQCKDPPPGPYDGVPVNAGTLATSFDMIGVSASLAF